MVNRCVCRGVAFSIVAKAAVDMRAHGMAVTLDSLMDATGAGTGCGMCRPYLARCALTGEAAVPVMGWQAGEAWVARLVPPGQAEPARPLG